MSQSGLKIPTTTEAQVRELALAKIRAKRDYDLCLMRNIANMTDEELADLEVERGRLHKIYWDASCALNGAI